MGSLTRRFRRNAKPPSAGQRETTMAKKTIDLRALDRLPTGEENGKPGPLGILLYTTGKEPIRDDKGEQGRVTVSAYLKHCIRAPALVEDLKDQLQIAMRLEEVHDAVEEQLAIDDGLIVLEGSHCDPLCRSVLKTQLYQSVALPSLVRLLKAFEKPVEGDLRKKLAAEAAEPKPEAEQPSN